MNSTADNIKETTTNAAHTAERAAGTAKAGVLDAVSKLAHAYTEIRAHGVDDALARMGLERRRSVLGSVAQFTSGFVVGAGTGLLFAPMAGRDFRKKIARSFGKLFSTAVDKVEPVSASVSNVVLDAKSAVEEEFDDGMKGTKETAFNHGKEHRK